MSFKPNVGDVFLNKYEIVSLVGEGAFGSVYRAKDIKLDRIVAIKFLEAVNNVLSRFVDEIDAIKSLDHPNIVRLYDFDILKGGIPVMVMEYVNGRELGDILNEEGPFSLLRICEIAIQVLDALVETHKHNIIHCDLKPENIMLTSLGARKDVAKLIDFGVASLLSKSDDERKNMLVGTPQYMAPEQILHKPLGPWTDIYAIGLILVELYTGNFVFDHDDPREVLRMQVTQPVPMPHDLACSELGPIISKAVEKDVSKRYQDTQDFYNDILDAMHTLQSAARQKSRLSSGTSAPSKSQDSHSLLTDIDDLTGSQDATGTEQKAAAASAARRNKTQLGTFHVEMGDLALAINSASLEIPAPAAPQPTKPAAPQTETPKAETTHANTKPAETKAVPSQPKLAASATQKDSSNSITDMPAQASRTQDTPKKSNHLLAIVIVAILFLAITGGGFYAWKTGMLEASPVVPDQVKDMLQSDIPMPAQAEAEPAPAPKPIVRFTTLRDAGRTMAYVSAISGHLGRSKTVQKYKTLRVIGTPITAKVFVNNSLVCSRSPCNIHIFGELEKNEIELRDGNAVSKADIATIDPKKPIILSIGN